MPVGLGLVQDEVDVKDYLSSIKPSEAAAYEQILRQMCSNRKVDQADLQLVLSEMGFRPRCHVSHLFFMKNIENLVFFMVFPSKMGVKQVLGNHHLVIEDEWKDLRRAEVPPRHPRRDRALGGGAR